MQSPRSPQSPILTKYTLKGSRARIILRVLMGNVEAALEILEWDKEDLTVLLASLLFPSDSLHAPHPILT